MLYRILTPILLIAALAGLGSSCNDSSSTEVASTGDCAITRLTLGSLIRTIYTTNEAGADTSYTVSVAGAAYPMYIDHIRCEIYNPDSLPQHTDIEKIAFSTLVSDGTVTWRTDLGNDTLFVANDTINFSTPRYFTCYSLDGTQQKTYRVTVNVHNSASEEFSWSTISDENALFEGITAQKLFVNNGTLCVLAVKNGLPVALLASTDTPSDWTSAPIDGIDAFAPAEVQLFKGEYYFADRGALKKSSDGINWVAVEADRNIVRLLAVGKNRIYSLATDGAYSSADGQHWQADETDGSIADFPGESVVAVWDKMAFNDNFSYLLVCGTTDGETVVWKKVVDDNEVATEPWLLFPQGDNGNNPYPALAKSALIAYDGKIIYAGIDNDTLSNFYLSSDGGRTWVEQTGGYNLPQGLEAENFGLTADDDDYVWITCAPSGQVLKGRLNRLSYDDNQKVFDR